MYNPYLSWRQGLRAGFQKRRCLSSLKGKSEGTILAEGKGIVLQAEVAKRTKFSTVMHHIMMLWSTMDHIYEGGPMRVVAYSLGV